MLVTRFYRLPSSQAYAGFETILLASNIPLV